METASMPTGPAAAQAKRLFTGLSTAGFGQDGLPLNVGLVVGVDGGVDVQRVLQVLPGAGVDHGPLDISEGATHGKERRRHTRVAVSLGTQEMKMILLLHESAINPPIPHHATRKKERKTRNAPLPLTRNLVLDIIHRIPRRRLALVILGAGQLGAERLVVLLRRDIVQHNLLLVVGDLEDDELGLAVAHAELVECGEALIVDGDAGWVVSDSHTHTRVRGCGCG